MKHIDIVFTRSRKKFPIGGWAIQVWTTLYTLLKTGKFKWADISHCAIRFNPRVFTSPMYYQASEGLVNYMSGIQFDKKHQIVRAYRLPIDNELYNIIRESCHQEAGAPYGTAQNIGIFLTDILSLIGIKKEQPWKSGRNCSELLYEKVIIPRLGALGFDKDKIKPNETEQIIVDNLLKLNAKSLSRLN